MMSDQNIEAKLEALVAKLRELQPEHELLTFHDAATGVIPVSEELIPVFMQRFSVNALANQETLVSEYIISIETAIDTAQSMPEAETAAAAATQLAAIITDHTR